MTRRFGTAAALALALALGVGVFAIAQEKAGGATETYTMTAHVLTADNCPVLCPCVFGQTPTHGHCLFAGAAEVEDGRLGDVSLKGARWGILSEFTGEVAKGPKFGFHKFYIDSRATPEQKAALRRVLSSAPWNTFGESKGIEEVAIDFRLGKGPLDATSFRIGDKGSFTSEPVRGGVDPEKPLVIQNPYGAFPGQTQTILGKVKGRFEDLGKKLDLEANSGEHHYFSMTGSVPAGTARSGAR